ncbi:MAG TPA: galactokinase family protein [bacterium]|nr:galactokinase family protein [bacterium]
MERKGIAFLQKKHNKLFGKNKSYLIKVPLRISPLGAHIDHQLGIVSGMTIDKYIFFLFSKNNSKNVKIYSENYNDFVEFSINKNFKKENRWSDYIKGAAHILKEKFRIKNGINGVVYGEISTGGLSSSAATGISYLLALEKVNEIVVDKTENISLMQKIENEFIGLNNGILDQSVILLNSLHPQSLIFIDCKSGKYRNVIPKKKFDFQILIVHSGVNRTLLNTNYNERVSECEEAGKILLKFAGKKIKKNIKLRDVKKEYFEKFKDKLPENLKKRATHFYSEIERVKKGVKYWEKGEIEKFGKLMKMSGESSIKNYECGIPETIQLHDILNSIPEIYGARFSGAGFGGSCIALTKGNIEREQIIVNIEKKYIPKFPELKDKYKIFFTNHGRKPEIFEL